jgi:predicted acetyltransferase
MRIRPYDAAHDFDAVCRIWHECGWVDCGAENDQQGLCIFMGAGPAFVAELEGAVECVVGSMPASLRYLRHEVSVAGISSVCTSHVARRRGLGKRLTAWAVAQAAADGADLSWLGIFDQGYYDRLGYGTGPYELQVDLDPADLQVEVGKRLPRRLSYKDWEAVHLARLGRWRRHGGCNVLPAGATRAEMLWRKGAFGLGFDDRDGTLGAHLWFSARDMEHGPYRVEWMAYRDREELWELLGLLRSLGDQVRLVSLTQPPGVQLQDLLRGPLRRRAVSAGGAFAARIGAMACWQMRICDLAACVERVEWPGREVEFNLVLDDPIGELLSAEGGGAEWRGISGGYRVHLGRRSTVEPGSDLLLPVLEASVGAFTRLWLGVGSATGLALTDRLRGPRELLEELDTVFCLPPPHPDWDF